MTRRFTQIKDLSNRRRLPRLGKIRLGIKKKTSDGREYPTEVPWFVVPPEVAAKIGTDQPTELDVMLPVEDESISFPQAYEMFGSGKGLKCTGDGETAFRLNEQTMEMEQRTCTCEFFEQDPKKCKQRAHLMVILHTVSMGGVYQIDTSSYNSIVDLNSSLEYVRAMIGRVALVPLKLKREPRETHHDGKKQIHYTMRLEFVGDINFVNALRDNSARVLAGPTYTLPPPVQENPELDEYEPAAELMGAGPATAPLTDKAVGEAKAVIEHAHQQRDAAPVLTKDNLLNRLGTAKNADQVNEILDLSNSLKVAEDKVAIRKAAAKRMQELLPR